ncbi:MAG TPA: hypothetical protein VK255_03015 [Patescibacteria group bacterium]|nr:hypothetical protein [Patescibacteria group bacterium]
MKKPLLIMISGLPASGKTTLAKKISNHFKLPCFFADEIKETISERICGRENNEMFPKIAQAAFDVFYKLICGSILSGMSCVAETLFIKDFTVPELERISDKCNILEIYLEVDIERAINRYDMRHLSGKRHLSHIADMETVIEKYGGKEALIKKSKINLGNVIVINTDDFSKINYENLYKEISNRL